MSSEPKAEAEKGAFQFPALVSLAPKRRFRANLPAPAKEEIGQLDDETPALPTGKDSNDLVGLSCDRPPKRHISPKSHRLH